MANGSTASPRPQPAEALVRVRIVPVTMVVVVGISWALPLGWLAWVVTVATLSALAIVAMRPPVDRASGATVGCLAFVGAVSLAYSAYALTYLNAFGPIGRLGYPLLVATGLRVPGGICLLLLCGVVSLVPVVFNGQRRERKEPEDRKD